ncbi:hypothetical protein BKA70DRAFT_1169862 [Coprinopsis sp. MPI-PUGE-AT-0042]|nr:hypothetical protein BKA70DRAFT_1169862 [Coprinopsis sp. MPI-PUGE-AT-0042]
MPQGRRGTQHGTYLVGAWVGTLVYGIYLCLFFSALNILLRKDRLKTFQAKVFLVGIVSMFILNSIVNVINLHRLVNAFALRVDDQGPLSYMGDKNTWGAYVVTVLMGPILWIGDALVIYRCYWVWKQSYAVIVLPMLLYVASVSVHGVTLWGMRQNPAIVASMVPILPAVFPLYLVQNILTTGLIIYKIWSQHRKTMAVGIGSLNAPKLPSVMRIIAESAAIHTVLILLSAILLATGHPFRQIIVYVLPHSAGLVFVFLVIRAHFVREEAKLSFQSPSLIPSWLVNERE